jgi:hypothetical protein
MARNKVRFQMGLSEAYGTRKNAALWHKQLDAGIERCA